MGALRRKDSSSLAGPLAAQRCERTGEPGTAAAAAAKNSAVTLASAVDDSHHVPATRHGDVAGLIGVVVPFGSMESYDRLRLIGEGACGAVFRARHVATGETVAVKIAHKNGGGGGGDEALLREAEMLAACAGNPAVVRLREVARHPETSKLHLVMDYTKNECVPYKACSSKATRDAFQDILVHCRWKELLMTRVFDAIKSLRLDVLSVQASAPDGLLGLKIRAKYASSAAVAPAMIICQFCRRGAWDDQRSSPDSHRQLSPIAL
uniref:Protein kinase domain-containing protein n=1 Tax=Oryza glumipatula TaxID=40148 RepID=A0A0D9YAT2_9ORYZ